MGYNLEQIKALTNPYQELGNGDVLAEHQGELDKLEKKEMIELASQMVLDCPPENLTDLGNALNALRVINNEQESFHNILSKAFTIKKILIALLDPQNNKPHHMILNNELNEEHCKEFMGLALTILKDNESKIAQRLTITTSINQQVQLKTNIKKLFPESELDTKVEEALALHQHISNLLLGEDPQLFFSHDEFSVDSCLEFSEVVAHLIKGYEKEIGEKLALVHIHERSKVCRLLEQLNPSAHEQESSFKLIASAMSAKLEQQLQEEQIKITPEFSSKTPLISSNNHGLFKSQIQTNEPIQPPDQEDGCCVKFLKLFF